MQTDIVEWLRAAHARTTVIDIKRLDEAADEIERLRAALREIADMPPVTADDLWWWVARAALDAGNATPPAK